MSGKLLTSARTLKPAAWNVAWPSLPSWRPAKRELIRAGVVCVVFLAHVLIVLLMMLDFRTQKSAAHGNGGFVVMASLVSAADSRALPFASAKAQKVRPAAKVAKPKKAAPKPAPAADASAKLTPTEQPLVHEAAPSETTAEALTDGLTISDQPVLSDADTEALAEFQPASAQGEPNASCNLTAALASDLGQNPLVRQGVSQLSASDLSVANAVQMWDGQWLGGTEAGGRALLRAFITRELSAGRQDCLQQVNTGPVFFLVPGDAKTVVLTIGSGEWSWGQLMPQGIEQTLMSAAK